MTLGPKLWPDFLLNSGFLYVDEKAKNSELKRLVQSLSLLSFLVVFFDFWVPYGGSINEKLSIYRSGFVGGTQGRL